jgi:hypothetical protein
VAPAWRGRVNGLVQGDKIRFGFPKRLQKRDEHVSLASEPRKFREDESRDVPAPHVRKHPSGLGVVCHVLARDIEKLVDLDDLPAFHFGV